jgi:hypothetical protein
MERWIQKTGQACFFYLFMFMLIFGTVLYNVTGFKRADGIAGFVLLILYAFYVLAEKKRIHTEILVTLSVFLFYLCYALFATGNFHSAVWLDFATQIKPYIAFLIVSHMALPFSGAQKKLLKRTCLCIWPFFIPIGVYGLINPAAFHSIMEHETNFVSVIVCLSLVYLYAGNFSVKERLIFLLMLVPAAAVLYILQSSVTPSFFLFGAGGEPDLAAHSVLYRTAACILTDFFPLGSGLGSFGSEASGIYYSQVYATYGLNTFSGFSPTDWHAVSTAYYPALAQFGIVGILLCLFFWVYVIARAFLRFRQERDIQQFVILLAIVGFILLANVRQPFLTGNGGFFLMTFLGLLAGRARYEMPDPPGIKVCCDEREHLLEKVAEEAEKPVAGAVREEKEEPLEREGEINVQQATDSGEAAPLLPDLKQAADWESAPSEDCLEEQTPASSPLSEVFCNAISAFTLPPDSETEEASTAKHLPQEGYEFMI